MEKAVIYARYSSEKQTEQSIEGQLRDCYEFAQKNNYEVVREYIDRAISGRSDNRPAFLDMIRDSSHGNWQYVIVWKLDRFSRDRIDSAVYRMTLRKNKVKILSAKEEMINSETPESILLEAIIEAQAQMYSLDLAQKVRRGQRETISKGQFIGGHLPLGYKCVNKKIVIDTEKAEYVKYLFEEYAKGKPKKQIVSELNARGATGVNGRPLSIKSVQQVYTNLKYTGKWSYDGQQIDNMYPAIIDENLFKEVQKMQKKNKKAGGSRTAKHTYALSGKLYCAYCGAQMIGVSGTSRDGSKYYYYACANHYKDKNTCKKSYEKQDYLENEVLIKAHNYLKNDNMLDKIAKDVIREYNARFDSKDIIAYEKRLEQVKNKISRATDDYLEAPKSLKPSIAEKVELLTIQKEGLEFEIAEHKAYSKSLAESEVRAWLNTFINKTDNVNKQINAFVHSIYTSDDVTIVYYRGTRDCEATQQELFEQAKTALNLGGSSSDAIGSSSRT